jgi:hypothetical protein
LAGLAKLPGEERGKKWLGENRLPSVSGRIWCYSVRRGKSRRWGRHACRPAKNKEERFAAAKENGKGGETSEDLEVQMDS